MAIYDLEKKCTKMAKKFKKKKDRNLSVFSSHSSISLEFINIMALSLFNLGYNPVIKDNTITVDDGRTVSFFPFKPKNFNYLFQLQRKPLDYTVDKTPKFVFELR